MQGAYGESAFEELDEIFYILQPNCIFKYSLDLKKSKKNKKKIKKKKKKKWAG